MRIIVLAVLMIFTNSAFAGLYKWVDEEGNVNYSQNPPKDTSYKTLKAPPPPPKNSQPAYSINKEDSAAEDTIKAESAKNAKLREKNCEIGKNNLRSYQTYRRIQNKDGSVSRVDDKERARQIESAKQLIRDFCDSP